MQVCKKLLYNISNRKKVTKQTVKGTFKSGELRIFNSATDGLVTKGVQLVVAMPMTSVCISGKVLTDADYQKKAQENIIKLIEEA